MIGEYGSKSDLIKDLLPTVFSYLAACFMNEEVESKLQILNCVSKVIFLFYGFIACLWDPYLTYIAFHMHTCCCMNFHKKCFRVVYLMKNLVSALRKCFNLLVISL